MRDDTREAELAKQQQLLKHQQQKLKPPQLHESNAEAFTDDIEGGATSSSEEIGIEQNTIAIRHIYCYNTNSV
jgi:hypothetical protein